MTLRLELPPELASWLKAEADRRGLPIAEYALNLLQANVPEPAAPIPTEQPRPLPKAPTARELLALPPEERDRALAAQAEDAALLYEDDLSRPVAERELTALTALDGEPFCDDE
jgi:hypothetical protein